MAHYLFYAPEGDNRWISLGPLATKEETEAEVNRMGSAEFWFLHKEFTGTQDQINAQIIAYKAELVILFTQQNPLNPNSWRFGARTAIAPNWGVSDAFVALPWVGTYYPGYIARNRQYWRNPTFSNAALALRYAGSKIAEMAQDQNGYACYPRVATNPNPGWFIYVPLPEVIGGPQSDTWATTKDVVEDLPSPTCGNCGRYGHRKSDCILPPKAHDRLGIEIEGRWLNLAEAKVKAIELTGTQGTGDGSVYRDHTMGADPWEFQTKPANIRGALEQLIALYPDSADQKCGMHVHVSFSATDIGLLTSADFFAFFKRRWTEWGARMNLNPESEFFVRLNGGNSFCRPNQPVDARDPTRMDRYAQLNFAAWNEHKTVECRLLPMFRKQSLAVAAVNELLSIFEDYLAQDFGPQLYTENVVLAIPDFKKYEQKMEFELPSFTPIKFIHTIEINELPPVAKGMKRIALPTGKTNPDRVPTNLGAQLMTPGKKVA